MGKKITVQRFAAAAALAAALLGASGCAAGRVAGPETAAVAGETDDGRGQKQGRTITVWGRESDLGRGYMAKAFARYEELTGNTVRTVAVAPEQMVGEVRSALADEDSGLDLLLYYGGVNLDPFDPDENFYDFSNAPWVDDLTDVSINQSIYHGKVIGLPHWEASVSGTLYNKRIFQKLGIKVPRTQEEFLQACGTLLDNGVIPLYLPCGSPTMLLYQFPLDTIVQDKDVLEAVNKGLIGYRDLPEMHAVVEWYCRMARQGYLGGSYRENDWDGMDAALKSGDYAMMLCWDTWLYTDFTGNADDFGLMPAFVGVPDQGTFEGPNLSLLMVNRHGDQVDEALELVAFMADPVNYNYAFEDIYTAPVFKQQRASISTPQYVEAAGWIEERYSDSIAWLRIKGFSQSDAVCILGCMEDGGDGAVEKCLGEMDAMRIKRAKLCPQN